MFSAKSFACLLVSVCVLCAMPALAFDDEMHAHNHEVTEQLGKVSFPISCTPASQKAFERGVALLHSFGYEQAEEQFTEIAQKDPACAMAHWGIAMSLFHQIWERPQEPTLKSLCENQTRGLFFSVSLTRSSLDSAVTADSV
jgi:hypothetical protein